MKTIPATMALVLCAGTAMARSMTVSRANYGGNCGLVSGNVAGAIVAKCSGITQCSYRVDNKRIGGPPFGCVKDFGILWRCGAGDPLRRLRAESEAGFGSRLRMDCR